MLPEPTTTPTTAAHVTKTTTSSTTALVTTTDTVVILLSAMQTSSQGVRDVMTTPVEYLNVSSDLRPLAVMSQSIYTFLLLLMFNNKNKYFSFLS